MASQSSHAPQTGTPQEGLTPISSQQHHQRMLDAEVSEATSRNEAGLMLPPSSSVSVLPVGGLDAVQKPRKNTSFKITNILPSRPPSNDPEEESGEETESTSENVELNLEAGLPPRMPGPPSTNPAGSSKALLTAGSSSSVNSSSRLAAAGRKASLDGNPHQLIRRISQLSHGHAPHDKHPLVFWASCQTSYVPSTAFFLTRNRAYVITALGSSDAAHGPKDRFKVVKITNPEPSQRGRWTGLDFADRQNPMASSSGRLATSRSEAHIDPNALAGRDGISTKMPSTSAHHHHHPAPQPQQQSLPASARHTMGPNGAYGPPQKLVLPATGSQAPAAASNKLPTPKPQAPTPVFPTPGPSRPGQPPASQPQLLTNSQSAAMNPNPGIPTMPLPGQSQMQQPQQPPPPHPQHISGQPYVGQVGPPQAQSQPQAQQKQPSPYALPTSQYMMVASTGANMTQGGPPGIATTVSSMTLGQDRDMANHPGIDGSESNVTISSHQGGQAHYANMLPTQHQQLLAAQQQQQGQSGMFSQPPDHHHLYYNPNHPGAPPAQHHYLPYTPQSASNGQPSRSSAGQQGVPSSGSGQPSVMANVQQQQQQQQQQLPHQSRSVDHEYGNFVPNHHPGFSHPPWSHLLEQFNGDLLDNDQLVERLEEISSTQPSGTPEEGAEDGESASGNSQGAIDNRIEQAMDLVKSHLMNAVRSEVEELKEKIIGLETKIDHLQSENEILKAHAPSDIIQQLPQLAPTPPQMILAPPPAANNANMNNIMTGPPQPIAIQPPQQQQQPQQQQP